ncbi:MAG: hypothetical protein ACI9Y1_002253 [Lentisphaeria bacterium]|jgi:hypothetical protein
MHSEVTANHDLSLIKVFIPVRLKRHVGRKTLISPQGQSINADRDHQQDKTLLKNLINAHRWQWILDSGKYTSISDLCRGEGITKDNISTVIRMVTLASDIQEAIINGQHPNHLTRADFVAVFPVDWMAQREGFGFLYCNFFYRHICRKIIVA